jgi:hypothetical protein
MVRFTVALWVIPAAAPVPVPVIVTDPVVVCDEGLPEQPATAMKTNIAAAIPRRVRNRCVIGIMNNMQIPRIRKTTWRTDAGGGVLIVVGGTTNDAVAVTLAVAAPPGATLVGVTVQDETFMVPAAQDNVTGSVRPPIPLTVIGIDPATPLIKLAVVGTVKLKSAVVDPVPVSATKIGRPAPSAICNDADSAAATDGVNVTPIVHIAPAPNDPPHGVAPLAVAAKSAAFAPITVKGIEIDAEELLVSVTNCAGLLVTATSCEPKLMLVGDTLRVEMSGNSATNAFIPVALCVEVWYEPVVVGNPVVA